MQNKKIKIFALVILSTISFFAATPVLATEYKTYTSESIGAGDKVYHVKSCKRVPQFGILYCNENNKDKYAAQCKSKDNKLLNVPIKMCVEKGGLDDNGYPLPKGGKDNKSDAIAAYSKKAEDNGCADEPDDQGFVYAPLYIIAERKDEEYIARGTIAWGDEPVTTNPAILEGADDLIKAINPNGQPFLKYKSAFCGELDVFEDKTKGKNGVDELTKESLKDASGELTKFVRDLASKFPLSKIKHVCNTNNIEQEVPDFGKSPEFGPDAGPDKDTYSCSIYERISGASGSDIFGRYVSALYRWAAGIVGIVAVLTMVYSGIQISMAGGDTAKLDSAKNRIMQSIIGLVILFLSGLILYTINPGFFTG